MNGNSVLSEELTAPRQEGANPAAPYYAALDGLRAVAVLMVFSAHYAGVRFGWMGVNIFFVLSGFLITGILYDSREKPHRFRNFYARRTLRIFPLYYGIWLALLLATPFLHISWRPENLLWPLYLGNWIPLLNTLHPGRTWLLHIVRYPPGARRPLMLYVGHFWSLCIEEQFYLVWPVVVFAVRRRKTLLIVCAGAIVACPALRMLAVHTPPAPWLDNGAVHNFTFLRFDEFLMGGLAALLMRGPERERLLRLGNILFALGMLCLVVCFFYGRASNGPGAFLIGEMRWILSYGFTIVDVTSLGLILLCLKARTWLARLMNFPLLRGIGRVSYGFYVLHDIPHSVYSVVNSRFHLQGHGLQCLVPFLGTLGLALLSYHFLEVPFLRLKTRFESGSRKQPVPVSSAS